VIFGKQAGQTKIESNSTGGMFGVSRNSKNAWVQFRLLHNTAPGQHRFCAPEIVNQSVDGLTDYFWSTELVLARCCFPTVTQYSTWPAPVLRSRNSQSIHGWID